MHSTLLRAISQGVMMMEESFAQGYYPLMLSILTGGQVNMNIAQAEREDPGIAYAASRATNSVNNNKPREKTIAVIPLKGAIIKYDEACGNYGTETVANWIEDAANNPAVDAIVIDADTGGGMGSAVNRPSEAIQNCGKPVIGYVGNGMCASAGVWIASNCDELYATYANDEFGSIGTYVTLANWKKFYSEFYKLDIKELYATKSTDKNRIIIDAIEKIDEDELKAAEERLVKEYIDPFNEVFIETVRANRPEVKEDVFTGKLYRKDEAENMGLIDGTKTFKAVLERAAELAA